MVTYPTDWDMTELGAKCEVTSSKRVFESEWKNAGIPFLRTRDIASFHAGTEQKDKLFISESTYHEKVNVSGEPCIGDLLVTGVGTIGLPYLVSRVPMYFKDGNILWVKSSESFEPQFLYLLFLANEIKQQIIDGSGFTTVGTFTIKNAKKLRLPCPEKNEQKVIAETLSCIDTHISNLTELIEKKKGIRDGALEDLVSGRTRLDGFDGEWEEKSLLGCVDLIQGLTYAPENVKPYGTLVLRSSNIQNNRLALNDNVYVDIAVSETKMIQNGDILICVRNGSSALIGKSCTLNEMPHTTFGAFMSVLRGDKTGFISKAFESHYIQMQVRDRTNATINQITKKDFEQIRILLPSQPEQISIVQVISSMDAEIASLEEEKDKMLQIKAGAMDDLLTGRVRLI